MKTRNKINSYSQWELIYILPLGYLFILIAKLLWKVDDIKDKYISVLDNRRNKTGRGRTLKRFKICILFLFVFTFSGMALSQPITISRTNDGKVHLIFESETVWNNYKLDNIKLHDDILVKDSIIDFSLKPAIVKLQNANLQADTSIKHLTGLLDNCEKRNEMILDDQINNSIDKSNQSLIKWDGLSAGLRTGYLFATSELNQNTFTSALINNFSIYCRAGFRIVKFVVSTMLDIPFDKKRSTGIMVDFGFLIL